MCDFSQQADPVAWLPVNTPTARAGGIKASPVYRILVKNRDIAQRLADVGQAFDAADPALLSGYHDNLFNGGTFAQALGGSGAQPGVHQSTRQEVMEQSPDGTRWERAQMTTATDREGRSSTIHLQQQQIIITAEAWEKMQRRIDQWADERTLLTDRIQLLEQQGLALQKTSDTMETDQRTLTRRMGEADSFKDHVQGRINDANAKVEEVMRNASQYTVRYNELATQLTSLSDRPPPVTFGQFEQLEADVKGIHNVLARVNEQQEAPPAWFSSVQKLVEVSTAMLEAARLPAPAPLPAPQAAAPPPALRPAPPPPPVIEENFRPLEAIEFDRCVEEYASGEVLVPDLLRVLDPERFEGGAAALDSAKIEDLFWRKTGRRKMRLLEIDDEEEGAEYEARRKRSKVKGEANFRIVPEDQRAPFSIQAPDAAGVNEDSEYLELMRVVEFKKGKYVTIARLLEVLDPRHFRGGRAGITFTRVKELMCQRVGAGRPTQVEIAGPPGNAGGNGGLKFEGIGFRNYCLRN